MSQNQTNLNQSAPAEQYLLGLGPNVVEDVPQIRFLLDFFEDFVYALDIYLQTVDIKSQGRA